MVVEAFFAYFRPIYGRLKDIEKVHFLHDMESENLVVPLRKINILRDSTCYNQGSITQYWYISAQKHKNIRIFWEAKKDILCEEDKEYLKGLISEFYDHLNFEFHKSALTNFEYLKAYFGDRDKIKPRICIKGYFETGDENTIITVFRDREVKYDVETKIENNTGFNKVHKTGKYYLCNNVYKSILKDKYVNPRIDIRKIKHKGFGSIMPSRSIAKIWENPYAEDGTPNYYNSTMIVPMTFWNTSMGDEFLKELEVLPNKKRTILGFLCFDHPKSNYFKEESDVSVAYIFADVLSQYLFARLAFTYISKTMNEIQDKLKIKEKEIDVNKIEEIYNNIFKKILGIESVKKIIESSEDENAPFVIDKSLKEYVYNFSERTSAKKHQLH